MISSTIAVRGQGYDSMHATALASSTSQESAAVDTGIAVSSPEDTGSVGQGGTLQDDTGAKIRCIGCRRGHGRGHHLGSLFSSEVGLELRAHG